MSFPDTFTKYMREIFIDGIDDPENGGELCNDYMSVTFRLGVNLIVVNL